MRRCAVLVALLLAAPAPSWAALSFDFNYVDDQDGTFASRGWLDPNSLFQQNVQAAADAFGQLIDSDETLVVVVDAVSFVARAGGQFSFGRYLGPDGDGHDIWEQGPLTRILTGSNPGADAYGFDIRLGVDAESVDAAYWLDPDPQARTAPVEAGSGDFMSVIMHEFGHGFGIAGNRDPRIGPAYGTFFSTAISTFDSLTYFGGDGNPSDSNGDPNPMFFSGSAAREEFGSDVSLSNVAQDDVRAAQNFYHLGTCGDPAVLTGSLMNGCSIPEGARLEITAIDRALLSDLGYPLVEETLVGDFNDDSLANFADLGPAVLALQDPALYAGQFPGANRIAACDANSDGACDFLDLAGLAGIYAGGTGSRAADSGLATHVRPVPEPASAVAIALLVIASLTYRFPDRRDRRGDSGRTIGDVGCRG